MRYQIVRAARQVCSQKLFFSLSLVSRLLRLYFTIILLLITLKNVVHATIKYYEIMK